MQLCDLSHVCPLGSQQSTTSCALRTLTIASKAAAIRALATQQSLSCPPLTSCNVMWFLITTGPYQRSTQEALVQKYCCHYFSACMATESVWGIFSGNIFFPLSPWPVLADGILELHEGFWNTLWLITVTKKLLAFHSKAAGMELLALFFDKHTRIWFNVQNQNIISAIQGNPSAANCC